MDFEKILFDLQPIIGAPNIDAIPLDADSQERYLSILDEVAVFFRAEHNRIIAGSSGLLKSLLRVLKEALPKCFDDAQSTAFWWSFASELIRCVANSLVDNDDNRKILFEEGSTILDRYVGRILVLNHKDNEELLLRTLAMTKNMCLENNDYVHKFSKLQLPLLSYLRQEDDKSLILVSSQLLRDFLGAEQNVSLEDLQFFADHMWKWSQEVIDLSGIPEEVDNDELVDPALAILSNFTQCLELVVSKESFLDFGNSLVSLIQTRLLQTLEELWPKQFDNKLIHMRRIITCIGHISAQESTENKNEREICYETIRKSNNG